MKPSVGLRVEAEIDSALSALAERLAKDIVDCDPAILSLIVVDSLGRVLHVARSARLPESQQVNPELVRLLGTVSSLIVGAANNATKVMGGTEAIVGIFKNEKALLINLPEYKLLLAIRLVRSANAEYVRDKIGDLLGTRAEP